MTIAAWINFESGGIANPYPVSGGGYEIATTGTGTTRQYIIAITTGGPHIHCYSNAQIQADEWHFITGTYDGAKLKLYIDGILDNSTDLSGNINNFGKLYFGKRYNNADIFKGKISQFQIWDYELNQSEIQSYMSTSPSGSESGLVGYWKFNAGSGTTLYDHSGNGNNGTINGATWIQNP